MGESSYEFSKQTQRKIRDKTITVVEVMHEAPKDWFESDKPIISDLVEQIKD